MDDDSMDKIAALNQILGLDPANAFARYGLAMEHVSRGENDAALIEFATCIDQNPDYVPAYQMSAQTLVKAGRTAQAVERLHTGIAAANRTGNQHALAEMEAMREELQT
jgi:predicted Zn-dependent protease